MAVYFLATYSIKVMLWLSVLMLESCSARPYDEDQYKELPECEHNNVCGYVQLNRIGVNSIALCRCAEEDCPLVWDLMDGRTVAHGNDQYKKELEGENQFVLKIERIKLVGFQANGSESIATGSLASDFRLTHYCNISPKLELCSTLDVVYSSYLEMSAVTGETLVSNIHIHCVCPPTHIFTPNNTVFHQYQNGVMAIRTNYLCKPPPMCTIGDTCMAITETFSDRTTFVTRKCACPIGYFCPNDIRLSWQREELNKGVFYKMQCL